MPRGTEFSGPTDYPFQGLPPAQVQDPGVYFQDNDHYRTRLTHTLEVSQIARTIGNALRLNNRFQRP